jgi:PTH1 family peptidyl-tRNA hydrolase
MNIVIGLGNPGSEYVGTRHNIGFEIVDGIAEELGVAFSSSKKTFSEIAKVGNSLLLVKPQTFMNHSGQAVRAVLDYYNVLASDGDYSNVYVVHDDLDLALGTIKLQFGTGPKSHNGLLSMYEHLGTKQFWHARVGVDNRGESR